jgi:hypothetical protein
MATLQESFDTVELKIREAERNIVSAKVPNPHYLADMRTHLAGYYSWMSGEKCELEIKKNRFFREEREKYKSDKACEAFWLASEEGELYTRMSYSLKGMEKLISSLRTQVETAQNEWKYA